MLNTVAPADRVTSPSVAACFLRATPMTSMFCSGPADGTAAAAVAGELPASSTDALRTRPVAGTNVTMAGSIGSVSAMPKPLSAFEPTCRSSTRCVAVEAALRTSLSFPPAAGSSYWTCSDAACTVTVVELVVTPPNPVAVST